MKKIVAIILITTLFALRTFAQNDMTIKQGHVNYTITVSGNPQAAQMMNGSKMSFTIKDSMFRMDMNMSMMQTIVIEDSKSQTGTLLMDMMGNKYAIAMSQQDIKDEQKKMPDYDVKYVDSTKLILGHICKKAVVTVKTKDGNKSFTVWYDPTMKMPESNKNTYSKINGLPMEYTIEQSGHGQSIDMVFECTGVDNNAVDPSVFKVPDGYQSMTMDQFKQAMSGMGGGK